MQIRFGDLDVIAEYAVEADFERVDAGSFALALFHCGDDLFAVLAEAAEFVELGVKASANDSGIRCKCRRLVGDADF